MSAPRYRAELAELSTPDRGRTIANARKGPGRLVNSEAE